MDWAYRRIIAVKCQISGIKRPMGAQWLNGIVIDSRLRTAGLSLIGITALCPWARHINPSLVLVQPRKTRPFITERLLNGRLESNKTNKQNKCPNSTIRIIRANSSNTAQYYFFKILPEMIHDYLIN